MTYETANKEILDLFRVAGKEIPHEDSDMGRAVQILQTICDSQSHTIPDANEDADYQIRELQSEGWTYFPGNCDASPYLEKGGFRFDGEKLVIVPKACDAAGMEFVNQPEFFEALEELASNIGTDDFQFEFDGKEYRLINEDAIWEIYRDEIQQLIEDCYSDVLKLDKIPPFIAFSIDWEQTAKNAYVDGYGHEFSSYDGSEEESAGYYIFRTN